MQATVAEVVQIIDTSNATTIGPDGPRTYVLDQRRIPE